MKQDYRIAELSVVMNCKYDIMQRRSAKYRLNDAGTNTNADANANANTRANGKTGNHPRENDSKSSGTHADIDLTFSDALFSNYAKKYSNLTPAELELVLCASFFSRQLLRHQGFLLHASAIAFRQKAILFSADSGVGKSTHTHLWQNYYGADAVQILNDDKPAIRLIDGTFYAYGNPFSGASEENLNLKLPLYAIVFLERSADNAMRQLTPSEALPLFLRHPIHTLNAQQMDAFLSLLHTLLSCVPVYLLSCNMETTSVELASNVLFPQP